MADKPCVVVLAADASEHSEYALQFYLDNIHQDCNEVHVVTCPDCRFQSADYELSASRLEAELQESKAQAGALEKKCLDRMLSHGVYAKFSVLQNTKPAHAILAFAKDVRADLIVTGTRGLGKVRRTIMGSVSDHILHNADVPVLICRRK